MNGADKRPLREWLFHAGVLLKGLDAALEIMGGLAAWLVNPVVVVRMVAVLTQDEAAEHSRDLVVNLLRRQAHKILFVSKHFLAFYLLGHGFAKLFAVVALIRNKLWAYPVAMVIFGVFIVYEGYRGTVNHHPGLIVFTALDVIVVILIGLEYRAQRSRGGASRA